MPETAYNTHLSLELAQSTQLTNATANPPNTSPDPIQTHFKISPLTLHQFLRCLRHVVELVGAILWTNLVRILKLETSGAATGPAISSNTRTGPSRESSPSNYHHHKLEDADVLVDAVSLINKTLTGIPDQDSLHELILPLEQQGIKQIAQQLSPLDARLAEQFRVYEQTLRAEDDEEQEQDSSLEEQGRMHHQQQQSQVMRQSTTQSLGNGAQALIARPTIKRRPARVRRPEEVAAAAAAGTTSVASTQSATGSPKSRSTTSPAKTTSSRIEASHKVLSIDEVNDHYESANESSGSAGSTSPKQMISLDARRNESVTPQALDQQSAHQQVATTSGSNLAPPTSSKEPSRPPLARGGKQQRASISSCSSSDSYVSYGSGYASGSGNSTDHDHKHRQARLANSGEAAGSSAGGQARSDVDGSGRPPRVTFSDDEKDTELNQHLNELEQLTDELSRKDIFGSRSQIGAPQASHDNKLSSNCTATIKSISSNASSLLSAESNLSSLSSTGDEQPPQQPLSPLRGSTLPNHDNRNNDNDDGHLRKERPVHEESQRSLSTTPTSVIQPSTASAAAVAKSYTAQPATTSTVAAAAKVIKSSAVGGQPNESVAEQPPKIPLAPPPIPPNGLSKLVPMSGNGAVGGGDNVSKQAEPYYHNLFQWEQLVSKGVTRPLRINDLDFTDLNDDDDADLLNNSSFNSRNNRNNISGGGPSLLVASEPLSVNVASAQQHTRDNFASGTDQVDSSSSKHDKTPHTPASAPPPMPPPPISPWFNTISGGGSRPQSQFISSPSPIYGEPGDGQNNFVRDQSPAASSTISNYSRNSVCVPQATTTPARDVDLPFGGGAGMGGSSTLQPNSSLRAASSMSSLLFGNNSRHGCNKRKKTMKLFWKEVREDRSILAKLSRRKTIWDEIKPVPIDTQKLEMLFESKAKDLMLSKSRNGLDALNQRKARITVLDAKRSNAINIGMTKLPPMRTIKNAILKLDSSIMNREGIEKILTTMMPTEEEKSRIIEAQLANPETPLGTAEQFLLNLASISALEARLKLWAFQLDYAQIEKEVADPLMDLKQAIEEIENSETFRIVLGTLLAIGNFLNSSNAKGFLIDYLEKVPEVKDTVHKHSLLHHLCLFIHEKYDPQLTSDLYSEFSAVNRASKVDYAEVAKNLKKMQQDCKSSWDYLKVVAKHDGLANMMNACSAGSSGISEGVAISGGSKLASATDKGCSGEPKSFGKLNNLSKLSMITTVVNSDSACNGGIGSNSAVDQSSSSATTNKQLKIKVSDFLTDCAERIMVLMVIHRRVMNRFQKLLAYLGFPTHQIKQTQPQQILKIINEFALEFRTKRERIREIMARNQQQQFHHHHFNQSPASRWRSSAQRGWAGSQQCIDTMGGHASRCCSSAFSCNDSLCGFSLTGDPSSSRHQSIEPSMMSGSHGTGATTGNNQALANGCANLSPSRLSQISNYSDYLFDQSSPSRCQSRQQSMTPVAHQQQHLLSRKCQPNNSPLSQHSMSTSMFDLQQQHHHNRSGAAGDSHQLMTNGKDDSCQSNDEQHQKDEQLRRLLGTGKSFDGVCNDLYQMGGGHWSSGIPGRVIRHPPTTKQRALSIDSPNIGDDQRHNQQSSYYRYLHPGNHNDDLDLGQNSDEEILQSLVRTTKGDSINEGQPRQQHPHRRRSSEASCYANSCGSAGQQSSTGNSPNVSKSAKNKLLSRLNCDRKSLRRTFKDELKVPDVVT